VYKIKNKEIQLQYVDLSLNFSRLDNEMIMDSSIIENINKQAFINQIAIKKAQKIGLRIIS
jgi:hypothetical protein